MPYSCFWLELTNRERRYLRRYNWAEHDACPLHPGCGHDAMVCIGDAELIDGKSPQIEWAHDDPRYPTHCDCGYEFKSTDIWQLFRLNIFRRADTGEEITLRDAPAGAMWDATWLHEMKFGYRMIDGQVLVVRLPGGSDWCIDSEASNGGFWDRTGTPPKITARPSIAAGNYHGWLTDGVLSDDLEGRRYA